MSVIVPTIEVGRQRQRLNVYRNVDWNTAVVGEAGRDLTCVSLTCLSIDPI